MIGGQRAMLHVPDPGSFLEALALRVFFFGFGWVEQKRCKNNQCPDTEKHRLYM